MNIYVRLTGFFLLLLGMTSAVKSSSFQSSSEGAKAQQPVNYKGVLKKIDDGSYEVDNISISGAIIQIPFYGIPDRSVKSPKLDTELIDLEQISHIKRSNAHIKASAAAQESVPSAGTSRWKKTKSDEALALEGIYTYNGRTYIELIVSFVNGTSDRYLVETSKEIWCDRQDTKTFKKVSFEVVESLTISGSDPLVKTKGL